MPKQAPSVRTVAEHDMLGPSLERLALGLVIGDAAHAGKHPAELVSPASHPAAQHDQTSPLANAI